MAPSHRNESIHYGSESKEGNYPLWHCVSRRRVTTMALCPKKRVSIMALWHKGRKVSIVAQQGEYPLRLWVTRIKYSILRCVTRRRESIMVFCNQKCSVTKGGEYPLWHCVTRTRVSFVATS